MDLKASKASETGAGPIPHREIRMGGLRFMAPVKLEHTHGRGLLQMPLRDGKRFIYALPGGGAVAA